MKKVLLLFVGVIVAFIANAADLYLVGGSVAPNWDDNRTSHWDALGAYTISYSNGYYYFKAEGIFQISTVKADWNDGFKSNSLRASSWGNSDANGVKTVTLTTGSQDNSEAAFSSGTVYYRISESNGTYTIQAAQSKDAFGSTSFTDLYLVGDDWGWVFDDAHKLATTDGITYTKENVDFSKKFLICGNNYSPKYGGWSKIAIGSYTLTENGTDNNTDNVSLTGVNVSFNLPAKKLTLSQNVADVYAFELWKDNAKIASFNNNTATYTISTALTAPERLCVKRTKNGSVDTTYGLNAEKTYEAATISNEALKADGAELVLATGLKGSVVFTLAVSDNVATALSVTGGEIEQRGGDDDEFQYTIYFYDSNETEHATVNAYVWNGSTYNATYPGVAMTRVAGKYYFDGARYYPVWSYSFNLTKTPSNVIINTATGEANKLTSGDATFTNNGLYTNGSSSASKTITLADLVEKPEEEPAPTTLYFHVKYDTEFSSADVVPMAHVFSSNGTRVKTEWNSAASRMTKVDEVNHRYSLWKYELTEEDVKNFDAVIFHFPKSNGAELQYGSEKYRASGSNDTYGDVPNYDKENWTKYIYATYSAKIDNGQKEFAVQTYLTYEQFKALDQLDIDNGGRRNLYLIGWNMDYFEEDGNNNVITSNPITFPGDLEKDKLLKLDNDHGCFYLPLKSNTGDACFKISWLDAQAAQDKVASSMHNSGRLWATFDLGLIGVNKDFVAPNNWKPNYDRNQGTAGKVWFEKNKSVPYMNYNQADWVMSSSTFPTSASQPNYWLVIDTHVEQSSEWNCKTATITSFNPQPSVELAYGELQKRTLADPDPFHNEHLSASDVNGHVMMDRVNYVSGTATIKATDISTVQNARFNRSYTIYSNGVKVAETDPTENITAVTIDYLPLSADANNVEVRAMYIDQDTKCTFHSRTGKGELTGDANFMAPERCALIGQYVYEGMVDDIRYYGVYVTGLDVQFDQERTFNGYSDFEFEIITDGYAHDGAELITDQSSVYQRYQGTRYALDYWEHLVNTGNDWSSALRTVDDHAPVFLHHVVALQPGEKFSDVAEEIEIECTIYAVYPFLYNPNTKVTPRAAAPARAAANGDNLPEGTLLTNVRVPNTAATGDNADPTPIRFTVVPDGAISAVENVGVDTEATEAEAEYYTISGMRVYGQPAPGLYIRRQGNTVTKVIIK